MRSASPLIAAGFALAVVGQAFAQTQGATPPPPAPESTAPVGSDTTPPAVTNRAPTTTAPSASSSGSNTSATAGAAAALSVGEPVKDNTGATIGSITSLNASAGGQQMAVIKMGTDTFQVPSDRLGAANGAAEINMTQAQITGMLHPAAGGH
jgi:hypothetical protein